MAYFQEARVKLTNTLLNKSKSAATNKAETILRLNKKDVEDEEVLLWMNATSFIFNNKTNN